MILWIYNGLNEELNFNMYMYNFRLRLKQNRFPVLLLTQADTTIFPSYSDVRTHCVMIAAEFAQAHNLLVRIIVLVLMSACVPMSLHCSE